MKLSRREIKEIIRSFMICNTPKSLYLSMCRTTVVDKLKSQMKKRALFDYYTELTARPKQTPISLALAYAYLTAFLTSPEWPTESPQPDGSRIPWGEEFLGFRASLPSTSEPTNNLVISTETRPSKASLYVRNSGQTSTMTVQQVPQIYT